MRRSEDQERQILEQDDQPSRLHPGNQFTSRDGEVHITEAIKNLIYKGEKFYGNIFSGKYLDSGTLEGYIKSNLEISKLK